MSTLEKLNQLQETDCVVDFLKKETAGHECANCGKCVYGYEGITQIQIIFNDISEKKGRSSDLELLERLCTLMQENCLCEKGDEIAQAVIYALQEYGEEIKNHASKKSCKAGVCKKFVTYHVLQDKCVGCGDCIDACQDDAIIGKKKFVHIIDPDECVKCGACQEVCSHNAIVTAGSVKPLCPKRPIPCKVK